jgi:hypothetical protein
LIRISRFNGTVSGPSTGRHDQEGLMKGRAKGSRTFARLRLPW